MPIVMENKVSSGCFGPRSNSEFDYPNYFAMILGPAAKPAFTKGFFDAAMAQTRSRQTVSIVARRRVLPQCRRTARARTPRRRG